MFLLRHYVLQQYLLFSSNMLLFAYRGFCYSLCGLFSVRSDQQFHVRKNLIFLCFVDYAAGDGQKNIKLKGASIDNKRAQNEVKPCASGTLITKSTPHRVRRKVARI